LIVIEFSLSALGCRSSWTCSCLPGSRSAHSTPLVGKGAFNPHNNYCTERLPRSNAKSWSR